MVLIAKASAVTGAILGGAAAGMLLELLIRSGHRPGAVWGRSRCWWRSVLVMVAGLIAENWCAVPPEDDDKPVTGAAA